jgi:methylase of polypeptide subunit release factors
MEISPMTEAAVRRHLMQDGRFTLIQTVKDLAGLARVIKAQRQ